MAKACVCKRYGKHHTVNHSNVPEGDRVPVQSPEGESLQEFCSGLFWLRFAL